MACSFPLDAIRDSSGVRIIGGLHQGKRAGNLLLPCGQCARCRLERSRQWAVRILHESKCWSQNWFLTLTYDDAHLPPHGDLMYPHFQRFMKYLRKRSEPNRLRFFCVGEYGSKSARPHYHAILFNLSLSDLVPFDSTLFTSASVAACWPHGSVKIGSVTFESAAYVARYCCDKVTGSQAGMHYRVVSDFATGEMVSLTPEFCHMSLKPGIGRTWFERFSSDVYPEGKVYVRGRFVTPPRYYDTQFEKIDAAAMQRIRDERIESGVARQSDNTRARLLVKDECARSNVERFHRELS